MHSDISWLLSIPLPLGIPIVIVRHTGTRLVIVLWMCRGNASRCPYPYFGGYNTAMYVLAYAQFWAYVVLWPVLDSILLVPIVTDDGGNLVTALLPCDGEYLEVLSCTYGYYFLVLDQYTSRCTKICLSKQFALTKEKGISRG